MQWLRVLHQAAELVFFAGGAGGGHAWVLARRLGVFARGDDPRFQEPAQHAGVRPHRGGQCAGQLASLYLPASFTCPTAAAASQGQLHYEQTVRKLVWAGQGGGCGVCGWVYWCTVLNSEGAPPPPPLSAVSSATPCLSRDPPPPPPPPRNPPLPGSYKTTYFSLIHLVSVS